MNKLLCILFCFVIAQSINAQITVTNSTFPVLGDTLRMSIDNNPSGITIDPPGIGYNWNWSLLLHADAHQQTVYKAATEGSISVPNATLFAKLDNNTEVYYAATANAFQKLAQFGVVSGSPGLIAPMSFMPSLAERHAPLNFFDIYQQSNNATVVFSKDAFPTGFFNELGTEPDSVRYRYTYQTLDAVDASGTLTIPGGSFDVLRQKTTFYLTTGVDVLINIGPFKSWIDISTVNFPPLGSAEGTDTTARYSFYSNNSKEPIVVLYCSSTPFDDLTITSAAFKNMDATQICTAPTGLNIAKKTDSTAQLSWTFADTSATSVKVWYRKKGDIAWIKERKGGAKNSINLSGLLPNTVYQWKLQSTCGGNTQSTWVNGPGFKTKSAQPSAIAVNIYPNPVTGNMLNVRFTNANIENMLLTISDLRGQLYINEKLSPGKGAFNKTVDVSALNRGTYILKIITEKGEQKQVMFVKQH